MILEQPLHPFLQKNNLKAFDTIDLYKFELDIFKIWTPIISDLHNSDKWKKAPWRRKVKLAHRLFQTIEQKHGLSFNSIMMIRSNSSNNLVDSGNLRKNIFRVKGKIINKILTPLRINFSNSDCTYLSPICILTYCNFTNKDGSWLTGLARRKNKTIHMGDLSEIYRRKLDVDYNIIKIIPLRSSYDSVTYHSWWDGFMEAESLKSKQIKKLKAQ
jgi:hypothetical protein